MTADNERLPCRGCTRDCPNYERCDGKPWRLSLLLTQSLDWAGLATLGNSERITADSLAA